MCRFCISQHPEVEKKVLAELDSLELLAKPGRPQPRAPDFGDLANMAYTYNAIKVYQSVPGFPAIRHTLHQALHLDQLCKP